MGKEELKELTKKIYNETGEEGIRNVYNWLIDEEVKKDYEEIVRVEWGIEMEKEDIEKEENTDNTPQSLEELCDYIEKYAQDIYIREKINDKWGAYSIAELPTSLALKHVFTFIKLGRIPHRIVREAGIENE
jgi:hypothetical protein